MEMTPEAKAAFNSYMRAWRAEHKENTRKARARYWEKKAEATAAEESEAENGIRNNAKGRDDTIGVTFDANSKSRGLCL